MALKLGKLFGSEKAKPVEAGLDMPTTQVKMGQAPASYDPLASVSIMEQLRSATASIAMPKKLPLIGHLPVVKQFQTLGTLLVTFLVFAALTVFLERSSPEVNRADPPPDDEAPLRDAPGGRR